MLTCITPTVRVIRLESGDCRSAPEKGFAEYPDLPREVEGTKPIAKRNMYD